MAVFNQTIKTYSDLKTLDTFEARFFYVQLFGKVGIDTFGFDRVFHQMFLHSKEWKDIRNYVIARDEGFDLGSPDMEIKGNIIVHHMNPIRIDDIRNSTDFLMNPEYLISTSLLTHNAIHYGTKAPEVPSITIRSKGDTTLWKRRW